MFGLPGAGKTTITSCLDFTKNHNTRLITPISVTLFNSICMAKTIFLRMILKSPLIALQFITMRQSQRLLLKLGLRMSAHNKQKLTNDPRDFFLADSGVLMPVISAVAVEGWNPKTPWVLLLIKCINLPTTAFCIDVDSFVAYERYVKREGKRSISVEQFISAYQLIQLLKKELSLQGVNVISFNNDSQFNCESFVSKWERLHNNHDHPNA